MRNYFDRQLELLNEEMTQMGALCEDAIALASKALTERSKELAGKVPAISSALDQKERDVEDICLKLLLRQQPVAGDLRQISAALKMITDMERIGDQAEDIAEIIGYLEDSPSEQCSLLSAMARSAVKMVTDSVDAYVKQDVALARAVIDHDDVVDSYFDQLKNSLMTLIAAAPMEGSTALDLLMIGKYFERIGDHATNIAEWVIFSVTGVHKSAELNEK